MRAQFSEILLIDGGDTGEGAHPRLAWKAPALWEGMREMGYEIIALGERDISDTSLVWLQHATQPRPIFLRGNVRARNGIEIGKPYVVIQRGGVKIGVVGVMNPAFGKRYTNVEMLADSTLLREADEHFDSEHVDYRILIYHGRNSDGLRLARELEEFDLILLGHSVARPMSRHIEPGAVPVVGPGDRAREVAHIVLSKQDGDSQVACTILPLDDKVPSSPKAKPYLQKEREMKARIASQLQRSRRRKGRSLPPQLQKKNR